MEGNDRRVGRRRSKDDLRSSPGGVDVSTAVTSPDLAESQGGSQGKSKESQVVLNGVQWREKGSKEQYERDVLGLQPERHPNSCNNGLIPAQAVLVSTVD